MMRLQTKGLSAAIDGRVIVRDVTLDAPPGSVTALVGINGSGKSTLLRAIAGVRPAPTGHVLLDGTDLHALTPRARAHRITLVSQDDPPPADLLVGEFVALGRTPYASPWSLGGRDERRLVLRALDQVGLTGAVDRPCTHLSGGEVRRVLLARGLAQDTPVVLLDEPTNHLDVAQQHRLLGLVKGLRRTVVMAIHDLDLAYHYADQVVVLDEGTVLAQGAPADVFSRNDVAAAFGVRMLRLEAPCGEVHLVCTTTHPSSTSTLPTTTEGD